MGGKILIKIKSGDNTSITIAEIKTQFSVLVVGRGRTYHGVYGMKRQKQRKAMRGADVSALHK